MDLTKILDNHLTPYSSGQYSDPPLVIKPWCDIATQGFSVQALALGTQTGTHIDAPAHFYPGGETLEKLDLEYLIGPFAYMPVDQAGQVPAKALASYQQEKIIFIGNTPAHAVLTKAAFQQLAELPAKVWVLPFPIHFAQSNDALAFHYALAETGRYLVEDLEPDAAASVQASAHISIMPLKLSGVSGSPVRVVVF